MAAPSGGVYIEAASRAVPVVPFVDAAGVTGSIASFSDGTLIAAFVTTGKVLEFFYSTDDGDTWTKCSTTKTGIAAISTCIQVVPAPDDSSVYVRADAEFYAFSWSGTDVTFDVSGAFEEQAGARMSIREDPGDSAQWVIFATENDSAGNLSISRFEIDKVSPASVARTSTGVIEATADLGVAMAWETDVATSGPHEPINEYTWSMATKTSNVVAFYRTNDALTSSSAYTWSVTSPNSAGLIYDETLDKYIAFTGVGTAQIAVTSFAPTTGTPTFSSLSSSTDRGATTGANYFAFSHSPLLRKVAAFTWDNTNGIVYNIYDIADDSWGGWVAVSASVPNFANLALPGVDSLTTGRLALQIATDDDYTDGAVWLPLEVAAVASGFTGWGIPMGIA